MQTIRQIKDFLDLRWKQPPMLDSRKKTVAGVTDGQTDWRPVHSSVNLTH